MSEDAESVAAQIVEAAARLFLASGYAGVSTEEIARSIGRSKKTLYKHFATKEALLHAVLARCDRHLATEVASGAAVDDHAERLRAVLLAVARRLAAFHRGLHAELLAVEPELGRRCRLERRIAAGGLLTPAITSGITAGSLRSDIDPAQALAVFFAAIEGLASDGDEALTPMVTLLVDGLRRR